LYSKLFAFVDFGTSANSFLKGMWNKRGTISGGHKGSSCSIVQEEYLTTQEIHGHQIAQEVRSLILQRLPLFLHEHTKPTRISYMWLNNDKNFIVQAFEKVTVTRRLSFDGANLSKSIETSAIARQGGGGVVELCLGCNTEVDMYDVATSLCHLLFNTYRVNDALLLMTILSTDLHALRRRGFKGSYKFPPLTHPTNWIFIVDRILRQQETERETAIKALVVKKAQSASVPKLSFVHIPILGSSHEQPPEILDADSWVPQVPTIPMVKSSAYIGGLLL
jgi:hypothetical protein